MTYRFVYRRYGLPFRLPVRTAHGLWTRREGLFVRLETEQGNVGYGECAPLASFGTETVDGAEEILRGWGRTVTDEQMGAVPANFGCLRFALGAARALQRAGETPMTPYLPVAALLPAGRLALPQISPKAEIGFRTFKWKVGVGDLADELGLLDDLIAKLPSGGKLRLDANGAWDRRQAERWLERCAERPIEFVEQPIAPGAKGAIDLLMGLTGDYPTPVALDESIAQAGEILAWLDRGWRGIFVVKPLLLGDYGPVLARLQKEKAAVVFSSALETGIGARAALQIAFCFGGETRALGFGVWPLFVDSRFDGPYIAPFVRKEDVERIDPEALWTALS